MKAEEYLSQPEQFDLIYSQGRSWASNLVIMRVLPNGLSLSRYGFVVTKRIGKAVVRNRIKRWLREILRQTRLEPGWDIVFIARPQAASVSFANFRNLILSLLAQAQLLMENYEKPCLRTN